jgi:hypothetical protein
MYSGKIAVPPGGITDGRIKSFSFRHIIKEIIKTSLVLLTAKKINFFFFFFFLNCHYTAFTVPFGRPFFQFMFLVPLPIGDATGLRGTFPGHPRPFHLTFTDIHNIYTPMGTLPDGTRTRADLAVVAERVLILPSTTLPSDRHTHTSMAGRRFLPLRFRTH